MKVIALLFVATLPLTFARAEDKPPAMTAPAAEKPAPAAEKPAADAEKPAVEKTPDADKTKPFPQLVGKSVVITYKETRKAKREHDGELGKMKERTVPFKVIVYVSKDGNVFNRLLAGRNIKSSDQTRGTKDAMRFAKRVVTFDQQKMSLVNTFGHGNGLRDISATFDDKFATCTAAVTIKVEGEYARRRLMKGGFELLYSATADNFACAIVDGNELAN
jgi:hypothetical protein